MPTAGPGVSAVTPRAPFGAPAATDGLTPLTWTGAARDGGVPQVERRADAGRAVADARWGVAAGGARPRPEAAARGAPGPVVPT